MNNYPQVAALIEQGIDRDTVMLLTGISGKTYDLVHANMKLEGQMMVLGAERYKERQEALESRGKEIETDNKLDRIKMMLKPMIRDIEMLIEKAAHRNNKGFVVTTFMKYPADVLSLLTLRSCLMAVTTSKVELTALSTRIGNSIDENMSTADKIKVGTTLINLFCKNSNECFEVTKASNGSHAVHVLGTTEAFIEWEDKHGKLLAEMAVIHRPMVVPPQPWTNIKKGGYWDKALQVKLIRNSPKATNKTHGVATIPRVYEAVNKIQATPFVINSYVLQVANELQSRCNSYLEDVERDFDNVPDSFFPKFIQPLPRRPITGRVKQYQKRQAELEVKLGITQERRTEHGKKFGKWVRELLAKITGDSKEAKIKEELEEVRFNIMQLIKWQKETTSKKSKNRVINTAIEVANDYASFEALYFPANLDWRGRVYPMCSGLTTQGVCLQKALIKFAAGKPIGTEEALYWLMVHTANCYGEDKAPWQDRLEWTINNKELIQRVAADPIGTLKEWSNTDDPWLFIAACEQMQKYYDHGLEAVVDIPIPMDGTCNGAQHYSAMSRDTHGAYGVNVAPNGTQGLKERLTNLRKSNQTPVGFVEWTKHYLTVELNRKLKSVIGE